MNGRRRIKTLLPLLGLLLALAPDVSADGGRPQVLESKDVLVLFNGALDAAGAKIIDMIPAVKEEVEGALRKRLARRPTVILVREADTFRMMSGTDLIVAYALPEKDVIVIDHSRMGRGPFSLRTILKHELCHLLLHQGMEGRVLPKWLDEGVAQWASDGIGEMLMQTNGSVLDEAAITGRILRLEVLSDRFPAQRDALALAYAESKSVVLYIVEEFGVDGLLMILHYLERGEGIESAVLKALSVSFDDLQANWRGSLEGGVAWFTYIAGHLYEWLFVGASLVTVLAFIKAFLRKRAYRRQEEEDSA